MSVAADAGPANDGVSPKHQMTPRPLRSTHVSPPPIPSATAGPGSAAQEEDGEDSHATDHEADAHEPFPSMGRNGLNAFSLRADPDAQATVTDFLDFTEYLPSDMERSLTLIAKLDEVYIDSSTKLYDLTDTWGLLPTLPQHARPDVTRLRADISASLHQGLNARVYSHAEALRMAENVNRHYFRAKTILSKLRTSLENYPEAEQQQQAQQQQKQQQQQREHEQQQLQQQQARGGAPKLKKSDGQQRMRRQRVPRITVPGEVLAPYEFDYETFSGESDVSSPSSEDESPPPTMQRKSTSAGPPRMKQIKAGSSAGDAHKVPKIRVPRESRVPGQPYISTSSALARLKPPPDNAVIGSADAPWLRLTAYELAKLRKRMKKNAQWSPSETMIARELKMLGRNLDAFNQAKRKAEADGRVFEGLLPEVLVESDGVTHAPPLGALSVAAAIAAEDNQHSNRGIKLNEAKKMKNRWAQLAAQEAEESTRRLMEAARAILSPYPASAPDPAAAASGSRSARATTPAATAASRKRKRDGPAEVADSVEGADLQKRVKTETPVPIPLHAMGSAPLHDYSSHGNSNSNSSGNSLATPANLPQVRHSMTPVPAPVFGSAATAQDAYANAQMSRQSTAMSSPLSSSASSMAVAPAHAAATTTTTVPLKPPAETPIHPPVHKSTTPIHPPIRELRAREPARRDQPPQDAEDAEDTGLPLRVSRASSRAATPNPVNALGIISGAQPNTGGGLAAGTTMSITTGLRRPPSRGASAAAPSTDAAQTQSLAAERPRRASTARNTPAPEVARLVTTGANKRIKRPAPGIVSRTSSGGSAAVGQRKAAPRKKRGSNAHQQRQKSTEGDGEGDVEVDDDGNVIDANEPRYCVCNRVSFGTMIQCDNIDEWFHLECVGMTAVPARTTKWYCPDCRVLLNIGEKGEVSARGVRM
ncbi:hypothetical protein SCUCBS95973_007495 [Sporothrix curviconia]|uniref:PHD-type domain-containing protein n=1 Tax=Sporothrix curviconia TaxID=1260050 RepID=A0ABP0CDV3_9PEZI